MASDPMSDLEHLISNAMGSAFEGARRALAEDIRRRHEADQRAARDGAFVALREASTRLDAARTQSELLSALLEEAGRFASRSLLLLTLPDGARGWAAFGFDGDAGQLQLSYDEPGLRELAGGRGAVELSSDDAASFARRLGGGAPMAAVLVPLVLRDRVAAALYADQLRSDDGFAPAALQLLAFAAAQSLELQVLRQRAATPTLYGAGAAEAPAALPLWDPAAAQAPPTADDGGGGGAAGFAAAAAGGAAAAAVAAPAQEDQEIAPEEPAAAAEPEPAAEPAGMEPQAESRAPASAPASEPWAAAEAETAAAPATADSLWQQEPEPPPTPAQLDAQDAIEQVPAEPWADDAPTAPGGAPEPWPVESAPAPWETEAEPAADAWTTPEEPAASFQAEPAGDGVPAEPWQYTETLEEVPAAPAAGDETAGVPYGTSAVEDGGDAAGVEEVGATAVEEMPAEPEPAAEPDGWQAPPVPAEPTSPLYPGAASTPSEATVRISRDLLTAGPLAPQPRPPADDFSEDRTVMLRRPEAVPPPASPAPPPPAPPLAPEPPRAAGPVSLPSSGSTEVQPPPDLEGPGWAFRGEALPTQPHRVQAAQSEETAPLHEEARRLARLLVSEIKLYNEEMVEEGRRHRDIYPRLQEDIDRSRQMYEERVDPRVRGEVDYFQQEMVNILAGGDASALGM